jgi:hypothetical protein
MTTLSRRTPHPLLTVLGMAVVLLLVGAAFVPVGFALAWVSDVAFGVGP